MDFIREKVNRSFVGGAYDEVKPRLRQIVKRLAGKITLSVLILLFSAQNVALASGPGGEQRQAPSARQVTYLLDAYPGAYAAYSLRRLSSTYSGPAIRVRRSSDNAEQEFGFGADDYLDTAGVVAFVGSGNGYVTTWYDQTGGEAMTNADVLRQPYIVKDGIIESTGTGLPAVYFEASSDRSSGQSTYLGTTDRSSTVSSVDYSLGLVVQKLSGDGEPTYGGIDTRSRAYEGSWYRGVQTYVNGSNARAMLEGKGLVESLFRPIIMRNKGDIAEFWQGNTLLNTITSTDDPDLLRTENYDRVSIGGSSDEKTGFTGYITEAVIYSGYGDADWPINYYLDAAQAWGAGPVEWNEDAILPQSFDYQVTLYNWLKTVTLGDVTLPPSDFTWDGTLPDIDDLADLWMQVEGLTTSRVTRAEPDWYVLDAGNGQGIEATGTVRIWHEPGSEYGGNPARSWANEPAFIYQLSIPKTDGSNGNPYYHLPAMGKRALVVAMVDMMMYHDLMLEGGFGTWQDMYGKAFVSWAETYRWTKDLLSPEVQAAFEDGMGFFLDQMIAEGPRAVNTNMDTFSLQGAAELYTVANDSVIRDKCVQAVKRALFGYPDGELGVKHTVFKAAEEFDGGVFDPSGFIMEGDNPEIFYGGESIYHLAGALAAVTDRNTGAVDPNWVFLEEVVRRLNEWRVYQYFTEPGVASASNGGTRPGFVHHGGAGFSGRTSYGVPNGQAGDIWQHMVIADHFEDQRHHVLSVEHSSALPEISEMEDDISGQLLDRSAEIQTVYEGTPPEWNGWSPWVKATPYLPQKGWYSRLKALVDAQDPSILPPVDRYGTVYNKSFGGYPVGDEYWAYKNTDGTREWGFFMEAQAKQGGYGGWYGGKIETFWTEKTGVVLINRHGKGGCDEAGHEDSTCWDNLDYKAAQHVWGRDEKGDGFTTLLLRGRELQRTSSFDLTSSSPSVTVTNIFNDPSVDVASSKSGEETGFELEGAVSIANKVEALSNGVRVTNTITSDGTDEITELWSSIPVFLRLYNPLRAGDDKQKDLSDTTIEYWTGSSWIPMPEDQNGDGIPEIVSTTKLRLGRDFLLGDGPQYVYVGFESPQRTRLSTQIYYDPYQSKTGVRTVHFDLHGNPGTVKQMPTNKVFSYTVTTTDPGGDGTGSASSRLNLQTGWNTASLSVAPTDPSMDTILGGDANIVLAQNEAGQVYYPAFGIDDIGAWNPLEAYKINTSASTNVTVLGDLLTPESTPLPLEAGWNLMPYVPSYSLPIEQALASIAADIILVTSSDGRVYYPEFGINDIGTMEPGEGYEIYLTQAATLTYPSQQDTAATKRRVTEPKKLTSVSGAAMKR